MAATRRPSGSRVSPVVTDTSRPTVSTVVSVRSLYQPRVVMFRKLRGMGATGIRRETPGPPKALRHTGRVITRPHVLLSAAQSLDGFLDDTSPERLVLSTEDDFAVVDRLRAEADAILVGAGTVRADNPRLLVRSPELRRKRLEQGKPEQPVKVTVTTRGLDPDAQFFSVGDTEKIVYAPPGAADALK